MKKQIALLMLLWSGMLTAQNLSSENASHVMDSIFDEYMALIPSSQYPTGFVYDKTEKMSALNSESVYNDSYKAWLDIYDELYRSRMSTIHSPVFSEKATRLFSTVYDGYQAHGTGTMTFPVGTINIEYNELQATLVDSDRVGFDGTHLTITTSGDNIFDTKLATFAAPMASSVYNAQDFYLYFGQNFYFSNVGGQSWVEISSIQYRQSGGSWTLVAKETPFAITPAQDLVDEKIDILISFRNGTALRKTILVPKGAPQNNTEEKGGSVIGSIGGWDLLDDYQFDEKRPVIMNGTEVGQLGILWSCENTSGKIHKPVLFVGGYQPFNSLEPIEIYLKFDNDTFMSKLRADEFDVVILKFNNSARKVIDLAPILEKVLVDINNEKMSDGFYYENVIVGYSLGALVAKYTLSKMEKQYLAGTGPFHHTRMYVSNDGEHQGASFSLGIHHALKSIQNYNGLIGVCDNLLNAIEQAGIAYGGDQLYNSDVAKETFIYFPTQTGSPSSPGQGPHPYRTQGLLNYQLTDHAYTYKSGYPAFTRNVGISKGHSDGQGISSELSSGQELLGFYHDWNLGLVKWYQDFRVRSGGSGVTVFRRIKQWKPLFGSWHTIIDESFVMNSSGQNLENVPGSFLGVEGPVLTLLNACTLGGDDDRFKGQMGYVPTVSSLDLDFDYYENISGGINDIFKISPSLYSTNHDFGYPHLTFPNHSKTPFDAVYCQNHWSAKGQNNDPTVGFSDHTPNREHNEQIDFALLEITPETLYLQNRTIGNPVVNYTAWFAARTKIVAGNQVTETTPHGNWIVSPGSTVRVLAPEFDGFTLANGTEIQLGSDFATVYHEMPDKEECLDKMKSLVVNSDGDAGLEDADEMDVTGNSQIADVPTSFRMYPNPVTSGQIIRWNVADVTTIVVYSMDGRKISEIENKEGNRFLQIDYPAGTYMVTFVRRDAEQKMKLCISGY